MQTRIVFFGSSPFSLIVLEKLLSAQGLSLCAVVTTPDQPAGRHLRLTPNPVKTFAEKHGIQIYTDITSLNLPPLNLRGGTKEGDIIGLVAAYSRIIPQSIIDVFGDHIYNIHPSLLPKYRGPSPLQQQILDSVTETGVTIIQLDAQIDHGPIVTQKKDIILPDDTTQTLGNRLFAKGTDLFLSQLRKEVPYKAKPQNHSLASHTRKLTRQDGFVPWKQFQTLNDSISSHLDRMFRAYFPWPGIWTVIPNGKRLKLIALNPKILVQLEGKTSQPWPIIV